jgi:hypothetical protein
MPRGWFPRFTERIRIALAPVVHTVDVVRETEMALERIEASFLTATLHDRVGGHVLGVTDADLVDEAGSDDFFSFMFGGKDHRNQVAVVSTHRLDDDGPRVTLERTVKVALHEIGHNYGLAHHYAFVPAADGAYCPMSKGDYNRYGERAYVRAVIDSRGNRFCDACQTFMRRVAWASTAVHGPSRWQAGDAVH